MELLQLRYFQTVGRLEHMTKAAEQLQIAQPSLSKTISRLEADLGVPLFERQGRNVRLSKYGKIFLQRVDRALFELEEARREIQDLAGIGQEVLSLAVSVPRILPELLGQFFAHYPEVRLRQSLRSTSAMVEGLASGDIDLCISSVPLESPDIVWEPLLSEELFVIVSPNHPLASRQTVRLNELRAESFVSMNEGYGFREFTDSLCREAGFTPYIAYEGDQLDVIGSLVQQGLGIAFVPAFTWQRASKRQTHRLRIEHPVCRRTIGLAWSKHRYLTQAAEDLRMFAVQYFARLQNELDGV